MKRFLLSSLLLLGMGRAAFGYVNNGIVQVPPMDPQLVVIDDTNFVNKGRFSIDMSAFQIGGSTFPFTVSDTLNYTNSGVMTGVPGFDFATFPASMGQVHMAANFVNTNNGISGGEIYATNTASILGIGGFITVLLTPINFETAGLAVIRVRATNVLDSGLMSLDNAGLIDISGQDLDLRRGRFLMTSGGGLLTTTFGLDLLDWASGLFGNTNNAFWDPAVQLTPTTASTPPFVSSSLASLNLLDEQMALTNATPYFENLNPSTNAAGIIVWRGVYLQDSSPANVTKNVYFDSSLIGNGAFHIEWAGAYRDPLTGQQATNFFYLSDDPAARRNTNGFFANPPSDFTFFESPTRQLFADLPATPGYVNPAPPGLVSNDFSYISIRPTAVAVDTNSVVGGSPTNLPGRVQFSATRTMNLANVRVSGPNYVSINSPFQFLGNSNALILAPYSDLNLGVTNGSLTLSNLLVPGLPAWTGVPGAPSAVANITFTGIGFPVFGFTEMGGLQAWSGSYFFVDANGITNDVRMLLVNSALQPTAPALQKDVHLHATNDLVIADVFNIFGHFFSDATTLTLRTNDNSAFSLGGQLNLLSSDIFWSASLPNLKFLTNFGVITTKNLANFAGNMLSATSDSDAATPYEAFVNHGTITAQGIFIKTKYFENTGTIQQDLLGGIDINVATTAIATNSSFIAPQGPVSIAANSLLLSNGVIVAGQTLTLTTPCSLSDGYAFENEFGHITNSILPNVVTNGNTWSVGAGVRIMVKPPTADLLGTTISNTSLNGLDSISVWPGEDRGCSPGGYATNLALGRMILNADANPSSFSFVSLTGSNALYVDSIEFQGSVTNSDNLGNFPSISIAPGMKIYYAQALMNGVSIAEKLNGKNNGGFCWVSNYAGVYSSTNILYPDNNSYIFNEALAISPDIDTDGDGTVNRDDATPIPTGLIFDIVNIGPQPCDLVSTNPPGNPGNPTNAQTQLTGHLNFPVEQSQAQQSSSNVISFALAQGSYNGLFYETNGVNPAHAGLFTAKVTSKGGLSAKIQLGAHTYSFSKPPFDVSGHFSNSITGKGLAPITVDIQLVNNDQIVGEVSGNGWSAQLLADRAAFGSKNKTPLEGSDTLLLSNDETNFTTATGTTYGTVKVGKSGDVQWSGVLPDNKKVTEKSALSQDGVWPLYSSLYDGTGILIGWMQFTNGDFDIEGSAVWIVPAGKSGVYPNGLTNDLDATGSDITGSIGALSHGTMILSSDSLVSSLTNNVTILGKTGQSTNSTLKLSVNLKTGLFSGSVMDPSNSSKKLSFQGALLEKSGIGGGFFLNAAQNQGGKVYLAPAN